jgi:membrane protein involved in colicin uptake
MALENLKRAPEIIKQFAEDEAKAAESKKKSDDETEAKKKAEEEKQMAEEKKKEEDEEKKFSERFGRKFAEAAGEMKKELSEGMETRMCKLEENMSSMLDMMEKRK